MTQPPPSRDAYLSMRRFQTYFRDVIDPAVWPASHPLDAAVHLIPDDHGDPITPHDAWGLDFIPVAPPCTWGPRWATAWFKVSGVVPAAWAGRRTAFRFSSGTEGQLWLAALGEAAIPKFQPLQGFDVNRDAFHLTARGGERFTALVEAACNHPLGVGGFEWDGAEVHRRWAGRDPGRFERCELAVFEPACWELRQHYGFALNLLEDLPLDSARAQDLIARLRAATNLVDQHDVARTAERALEPLREALSRRAPGSATRCFAVGHAHLDTAWLWRIRESRRKVLRTFSNQLRNLERFPDYRFLASQAQHYAWAEELAPELFTQIKARIAEGRWECGGAMWIEPDVNCVSGESLVRQILHGERWWRSRFGDKGRQRFLYLPDTFGFGSNLPQIMRLAGLDTFITNKLHWWQHTTFPHTTFVWRGIDGSWVLAHNTPGQDYNATNTPKELRKGETTHRTKDARPLGPSLGEAIWLQPFGFGDGGGGATDWSIRFAEFAADCDGLPRVELSSADAFCDALHEQHARGAGFPEWFGELDMEIHRGTLTSQAWIKRANREAEEALRLAEVLTVLSAAAGPACEEDRRTLDQAWKLTLLNQFHDILPGSSIGPVYEDAKKDHAEIQRLLGPRIERGTSSDDPLSPTAYLNPTSRPFSGVAPYGPEEWISEAPALGVGVGVQLPTGVAPVTLRRSSRDGVGPTHILSNGLLTAEFSDSGDVVSLVPRGGRDLAGPGRPLTSWALHEDRPIMWDAWDIDHYYADKARSPRAEGLHIRRQSPLRAVLAFNQSFDDGASWHQVEIVLDAGSPRIDLVLPLDWRPPHTLLRFRIHPELAPGATCTHGVHFGAQTRPLHRNTAHDRARFEFPAQGWVDVSEAGAGLALLAPHKFGYSAALAEQGVEAGVSILRSPGWPDPAADRGWSRTVLSLVPHLGDWRAAGVARQSELLRRPPRALRRGVNPHPPFEIRTPDPCGVEIDAFKPAEDGDDLILRFHECHGVRGPCTIDWGFPVRSVRPVDLLERESEHAAAMEHTGQRTVLSLRPFQIITLRIAR